MRTKETNRTMLTAGILTLAMIAVPGWATTYTWDGSESGDWGTAGNWAGSAVPPSGNAAVNHVVSFYQAGAGNLDTFLGAGARNIATLNFTADADSDVNIRMDNNGTTARSINLYSSSGENAINVASGAEGSFRIWSPVAGGRINMTGNLAVNHEGSGLLTVEKINNTAGATVTKTGTGTLKLVTSSSYAYNGATTVNGGTLLVDGTQNTVESFSGGITVNAGAVLGGVGAIVGNIVLADGAKLLFDPTATLTANGTSVDLGNLSIAKLAGLDSTVEDGTYTLINGTASFDFTGVQNLGLSNKFDLGSGKSAYFEEGSLNVVVIPEPATLGLVAAMGGGILFIRRLLMI